VQMNQKKKGERRSDMKRGTVKKKKASGEKVVAFARERGEKAGLEIGKVRSQSRRERKGNKHLWGVSREKLSHSQEKESGAMREGPTLRGMGNVSRQCQKERTEKKGREEEGDRARKNHVSSGDTRIGVQGVPYLLREKIRDWGEKQSRDCSLGEDLY